MTKYIGTITITVEADNEADVYQLAVDFLETTNLSDTTRTYTSTSISMIEVSD